MLPVGDGLAHRGRVPAPDPRLDRVDGAGGERRIEAQVREQRADRSLVGGRLAERDQGPAHLRLRERQRRFERDRDPHVPQNRSEQASGRVGMAEHDDDLVRRVAGAQEAGDLDPDRLGLAARPGRLQQHQAFVGRDPRRIGLEQHPIEVAQRGAARVALVEGKLARDLRPELAQLPDQLGPRRQRPAIGEGDRDGDVSGPGERVDQLALGAGEVVEPVDEHRPGTPRVGVVAQGADRRGERRRPVAAAARLAQLDVAGIETGELALVSGVVELVDDRRELARGDQRRLELGDQPGERRGEPGPGRRASQASGVDRVDRRAHQGLPLRDGELGVERRGQRCRRSRPPARRRWRSIRRASRPAPRARARTRRRRPRSARRAPDRGRARLGSGPGSPPNGPSSGARL